MKWVKFATFHRRPSFEHITYVRVILLYFTSRTSNWTQVQLLGRDVHLIGWNWQGLLSSSIRIHVYCYSRPTCASELVSFCSPQVVGQTGCMRALSNSAGKFDVAWAKYPTMHKGNWIASGDRCALHQLSSLHSGSIDISGWCNIFLKKISQRHRYKNSKLLALCHSSICSCPKATINLSCLQWIARWNHLGTSRCHLI